MSILETRNLIINRLKEAAELSNIHPAMLGELEDIRAGANPRDIIDLRWSDLMLGRFDERPLEELVELFNELA